MSEYDKVAKLYSGSMSEEGDYYHKSQIDPYIYKIIGDPKGKVIYDIGCGNGYISRNLARHGAKVFASDISGELIKIAKEKSSDLNSTYSVHDATDFSEYKDGMFDMVVMNMVIHYIKGLDTFFSGVSRILKKDGVFAFSTNHPFRPSYPFSEWETGKINNKETLFIKVTGYLKEEMRKGTFWLDRKTELTMYNQPLNLLVNTMSKHNLLTFAVEEPESDGFAKDFSEELQKSHHIPTYIIIGAVKK